MDLFFLLANTLSAIDAEVIDICRRKAIGFKRNVEVFVNQEIVARSLANDAKIVDKRFLNSNLRIEFILSDTCGLILVSSRLAVAANALWLEMGRGMDSSSLVHSEMKQNV